jgi:oligopeptide/dipeptide ABC transporter ATP-binding protein
MALLEVRNLKTYFKLNEGLISKITGKQAEIVKAVDNISFDISESEIVGIVGETGCGKTTLAKTILLLIRPEAGEMVFEKKNLLEMNPNDIREVRSKVQMIPQNTMGSLNPRMMVRDIIAEPLRAFRHHKNNSNLWDKVAELLKTVDLSWDYANRYSFQLSGGEARRVTIARSLAINPKLIICDEPTSGLDVSIGAKILNVMKQVHDDFQMAYLWISHNLHEVSYISDKILVFYLGKIVEAGRTSAVFNAPAHPYTKALIGAMLELGGKSKSEQKDAYLRDEVPSPINPPSGCRFHPRCQSKGPNCSQAEPQLINVEKDHQVACALYKDK